MHGIEEQIYVMSWRCTEENLVLKKVRMGVTAYRDFKISGAEISFHFSECTCVYRGVNIEVDSLLPPAALLFITERKTSPSVSKYGEFEKFIRKQVDLHGATEIQLSPEDYNAFSRELKNIHSIELGPRENHITFCGVDIVRVERLSIGRVGIFYNRIKAGLAHHDI